jgi:hypothetical protein
VSDWPFLRAGLLAVGALWLAALAGWGVYSLVHEEPGAFAKVETCLASEKGLTLEQPRDPIAGSAELGAVRTVVETNGVTIAVARDSESAERIVAAYRSVASDLEEGRLERRGRLVFLWDRPASPTQRQALFECEY